MVMRTARLLVSDHESMMLTPSRSTGLWVAERRRSATSAACTPPPLVVAAHRDHRGGDGLGPRRFIASWLPARTAALAEVDADDLAGRRLHTRHLVPRQLRPDAIAIR